MKAPVVRDLARMAWPVLVAQVAVMLYGVIDTLFAGRYGTVDLAAVGIGSSIYISVFMATVGVLLALMPVAAQLYGAGRHAEIGESVRQTLWLGLAMMALAMLLMAYPEPFFTLTRASPEVEAKVRGYLRAILVGVPALMFFRVFSAFSTAISRPRVVMTLNLVGLAVKVPLSWALMFGRLGLPELGAPGCGLATAIAAWVTCVAAYALMRRGEAYAPFHVFARWSWPRWSALRHLLSLGLPIGFTFFVDVTAFTFMTLFVARLGTATAGAHQIAANFAALLFMLPLALGNAAGVLVGQAIGGRELVRARHVGAVGILLAGILALVSCVLLSIFKAEVAAFYSTDPAVQAVATGLLAVVAFYHLVDAVQAVVMNALRGYKRTVIPMLVTTGALWGIGLGGGYVIGLTDWNVAGFGTVGLQPPLGARGFWIAAVASVTLAAATMVWYFGWVSRRAIARGRA